MAKLGITPLAGVTPLPQGSRAPAVRIVSFVLTGETFADFTVDAEAGTLTADGDGEFPAPVDTQILATGETDDKQGWWTVTDAGAVDAPAVLTRTTGAEDASQIVSGTLTVEESSGQVTYLRTLGWPGSKVLGVDAMAFASIAINSEPLLVPTATNYIVDPAETRSIVVLADISGGSITVTIPDAADWSEAQTILVKITGNAGGESVTIDTAGGSIDGAASTIMDQSYSALLLMPVGSNWVRIAYSTMAAP